MKSVFLVEHLLCIALIWPSQDGVIQAFVSRTLSSTDRRQACSSPLNHIICTVVSSLALNPCCCLATNGVPIRRDIRACISIVSFPSHGKTEEKERASFVRHICARACYGERSWLSFDGLLQCADYMEIGNEGFVGNTAVGEASYRESNCQQ